MKRYRVELSPNALEQAESIRDWWIANRPTAPDLFVDELEAAMGMLRGTPRAGVRYEAPGLGEMRRVLMPRTRYHVYYTVERDSPLVQIHAIWHSSRGHGPPLR